MASPSFSAGPDWLSREQYDVVATVASPATKDQLWLMLQALLAERFKLSLHRETKLGPVYNLVVAKHGVKLQAVSAGPGGIKTSSGKNRQTQRHGPIDGESCGRAVAAHRQAGFG